jgi:hypothetical protein
MADHKLHAQWASSRYSVNQTDGIRVRIEIACAEGVDAEVFAYCMSNYAVLTGERAGRFSHVCSTADLAEYPIGAPIVGEIPEWFRLSYVDVFLRSPIEAAAFVEDVFSDLRMLQYSLARQDTLIPGGVEQIGGELPCGSSSSASSMLSSASSVPSSASSDSSSSGSSVGPP